MYIGIDLGGTNTAAALVDERGNIMRKASIPTDKRDGADSVVRGLLTVCEALRSDTEDIQGVGIGVPGTVNDRTGEVIYTPNLPLAGTNITQGIRDKYRVPVRLGNDANCAALGEFTAGGAKGAESVVFVTLGTGVGSGIILGGQLYEGFNGAAAELGHMSIVLDGRKCGCGRHGCWEAYASATGLIATAKELMQKHKDSIMWTLIDGDISKIEGRTPFDALRKGDEAAHQAVELYITHLAAGLANIINIFEPELLCIGGGISSAWDLLETPMINAVEANKYLRCSPSSPQTRIIKAALGSDAGIIGAAMLTQRS